VNRIDSNPALTAGDFRRGSTRTMLFGVPFLVTAL
jgi:hypothetical protein